MGMDFVQRRSEQETFVNEISIGNFTGRTPAIKLYIKEKGLVIQQSYVY